MTYSEIPGPAYAEAPVPTIDERIAAAVQEDPTSEYMQDAMDAARHGEFTVIQGVSGRFAEPALGIPRDNATLIEQFNAFGLGTVRDMLDAVSTFDGPEMPVREFLSFDDPSVERFAELVASGEPFAMTGTASELETREARTADEPFREIWLPVSDDYGRLPLYIRVTAPVQHRSERQASYAKQDWMVLPQLQITPPDYQGQNRAAA
jgi:hypothetical protein